MRKEILVLALSLALVLAGCNGSEDARSAGTQPDETETQDEALETQGAETVAGEEPDAADADSPDEDEDAARLGWEVAKSSRLYRREGVTITSDHWDGDSLNVHIANDGDTDITVESRMCAVNGLICDTELSAQVPVGETAEAALEYDMDELEAQGVGAPQSLVVSFRVLDTDTGEILGESGLVQVVLTS